MATTLSIPERFQPGLAALLTAFDYAQDSGTDVWQFAIELPELLSTGATLTDLRWLIHRGYAEHAEEITIPGDLTRSFRPLARTRFPEDACVGLTTSGAAAIRAVLTESATIAESNYGRRATFPTATPGPLLPHYNAMLQELRLGGEIVKSFSRTAPAQELILRVFEEEGWPPAINDPLTAPSNQNPKRHLHYTVRNLNRGQSPLRIRFGVNGYGETIRWEIMPLRRAPAVVVTPTECNRVE